MRHIDKYHMVNDIILTLSLIFSMIIVETIMVLFNCNSPIIFFILTFFFIKFLYHILYKLYKKFRKLYGIRV